VKPIKIWRREHNDPPWMPEALAVYPALSDYGLHLVLAGRVLERKAIYIAPPVPSPACSFKLDDLEARIIRTILTRLGSRYTSACKVVLTIVYTESLHEALSMLVSLGVLNCIGAECLGDQDLEKVFSRLQ